MTKRSPDEFQRDIEMRQRNIVYPDTLRNQIRGWRSLITSKQPLSVLQVVGLLTLYLSALSMLFTAKATLVAGGSAAVTDLIGWGYCGK
jgi:hypothetical protein